MRAGPLEVLLDQLSVTVDGAATFALAFSPGLDVVQPLVKTIAAIAEVVLRPAFGPGDVTANRHPDRRIDARASSLPLAVTPTTAICNPQRRAPTIAVLDRPCSIVQRLWRRTRKMLFVCRHMKARAAAATVVAVLVSAIPASRIAFRSAGRQLRVE